MDPKTTGKNFLYCSSKTAKLLQHILRIRGMRLNFKYLGEFESRFKINLLQNRNQETRWELLRKTFYSVCNIGVTSIQYIRGPIQLENIYVLPNLHTEFYILQFIRTKYI